MPAAGGHAALGDARARHDATHRTINIVPRDGRWGGYFAGGPRRSSRERRPGGERGGHERGGGHLSLSRECVCERLTLASSRCVRGVAGSTD